MEEVCDVFSDDAVCRNDFTVCCTGGFMPDSCSQYESGM